MDTKKTPALQKAEAKLEAAKQRLATREAAKAARHKAELEDRLKNFDIYVESVVDAKLSKVLVAKTERKKTRIRDEIALIKIHYKKVRENMIKTAEQRMKGYKQPLYLLEAQQLVASAEAALAASQAPPKQDQGRGVCDSEPDISSSDSGISLFVAAHMPSTAL